MHHVTLYATPDCELCAEVREFLRSRGVQFAEIDIRQDALAFHQMVVYAGGPLVPVVDVDGDVMVG
ncbi:MAG: glutaredoxin family protein, partial [Acidobacteria bacterium]